ncbi:MAG: carbon-nitrogen hydrolase family protein [Polyangiaceae bacterium]
MRIAALEIPARWAQPERAFEDAERLLGEGPRADLGLFNELALTSYVSPSGDFDLTAFAEPFDGPTLERAQRLAHTSGSALAFPLVERDGERLFNTCVGVAATGEVLFHYRKRHPWFPETWASPGENPTAEFTLAGARLALAICYDVHFLATESRGALERADVLLFPSAWVDLGTTADLRAPIFEELATSFDVVIANANWGPGTPRVGGQGSSRVVGPRGEIARARSARGAAARVDCVIEI